MTDEISRRPEGIHLAVSPVTFLTGASISTLVGCTITAFASSAASVETAASSTTVLTATSCEAKWAVGTLTPGKYNVEVYATASGGEAERIYRGSIIVLENLTP
jgi:hypothetical protein